MPRNLQIPLLLIALLAASTAHAQAPSQPGSREQSIVDLTNLVRTEAGLKPLVWDPALAAAAYAHAQFMVAEGPISHRYSGEADLPERAAKAGAHFSLIEENIAVADTALKVHEGWMKSPGHHDNLLSPRIDRIGVALIPSHGVLYAVADYAQSVATMSQPDVEAAVGKVLAGQGITLLTDADSLAAARAYCAQDGNSDKSTGSAMKPRFLMRWQSAQITNLPPELTAAIKSGQFKQASVGACNPQASTPAGQTFSGFRAAALLY